jgi:hypothetical protein
MFDSGLKADQAHLISSNEKRYVVRETSRSQSVWIPVETTRIRNGFEDAWEAGALNYLQDGIIRSGINQGWIRIIDVD